MCGTLVQTPNCRCMETFEQSIGLGLLPQFMLHQTQLDW